MIVACGDRDGAKLAKDAEARWRRAIDAWRHRRQRRPGEHAVRAGQWLAAETAAGHTSGTGGSPRSIISTMFLRLARADESGIAEPSRMRHGRSAEIFTGRVLWGTSSRAQRLTCGVLARPSPSGNVLSDARDDEVEELSGTD